MKRKPTGEKIFFHKIWAERPHFCEVCNKDLGKDPSPIYFSHIIPKSRKPDLRLDPDNIEILCTEHHHIWDFGTRDQIRALNNSQKKKDYLEKNDYNRWWKLFGSEK